MQFLTNVQLEKLNTKRLISLLKAVRIKERSGLKNLSCDCCGEYLDDDRDGDYNRFVAPFENYAKRVKKILKTREHVKKER